jgi:hypothetical protein
MSTELLMRKRPAAYKGEIGLFPSDEIAADGLSHVRSDKDALVKAQTPRNPKQHALAWALATKLAEAMPGLHDSESAMDYLKIRARHYKIVYSPEGSVAYLIPKSISFASLTQEAWSRVFNRMVHVITTEILPGLPESDLRREIEEMVAGDWQQPEPPPHDGAEGGASPPMGTASRGAGSRRSAQAAGRNPSGDFR